MYKQTQCQHDSGGPMNFQYALYRCTWCSIIKCVKAPARGSGGTPTRKVLDEIISGGVK